MDQDESKSTKKQIQIMKDGIIILALILVPIGVFLYLKNKEEQDKQNELERKTAEKYACEVISNTDFEVEKLKIAEQIAAAHSRELDKIEEKNYSYIDKWERALIDKYRADALKAGTPDLNGAILKYAFYAQAYKKMVEYHNYCDPSK